MLQEISSFEASTSQSGTMNGWPLLNTGYKVSIFVHLFRSRALSVFYGSWELLGSPKWTFFSLATALQA